MMVIIVIIIIVIVIIIILYLSVLFCSESHLPKDDKNQKDKA